MRFYHFFALLLLSIFSGSLCAQEIIQTSFRTLSLSGTIQDLAVVTSDGAQDITISGGRRSDVFSYRGPSVVSFIRKGTYDPEGALPAPVASVAIQAGYRKPLLIFVPNGNQYAIFVIEDDHTLFSGGNVLMVNLTPHTLTMFVGEDGAQRFTLKPTGMEQLKFTTEDKNVRIRGATTVGSKVKRSMDTRIFPRPKHRDICFIFQDLKNAEGRVRTRTIRENVLTAKRAYEQEALAFPN